MAGYVGKKAAAPILIERIRKQEAYAGGYYTGITTICDGKMNLAKLTGALSDLLEKTDGKNFSGNLGIIHSRSNAGGGDNWAQPFVSDFDGKPYLAYAATGSNGFFKGNLREYEKIARSLHEGGRIMHSYLTGIESEHYPQLADGAYLHISDVMCHIIASNKERGDDGAQAMAKAFCKMPAEIVGLSINTDEPDAISFARIDAPLYVSFASHGAYVASMPDKFPGDASEAVLIPACSSGKIYADHVEITPFSAPLSVKPMDTESRIRAYGALKGALEKNELDFWQCVDAVDTVLDGYEGYSDYPLTYEALQTLDKQGVLKKRTVIREGANETVTAPQYLFKI
jgi:hypothetical protein